MLTCCVAAKGKSENCSCKYGIIADTLESYKTSIDAFNISQGVTADGKATAAQMIRHAAGPAAPLT